MNEIVRLYTRDGVWETGGVDRMRGIWPEDLTCSWDDWGPKTANFIMRRDPRLPQPDVTGLTPIEIEKGSGVWEGYVDQAPQVDDHAIGIEAIGWPDHANDDTEQKVYVQTKLTEWKDWRSHLLSNLASFKTGWSVEVGDGGIVIQNSVADAGFPRGGVYLDLGPQGAGRRIVIDWAKNQWAGTATAFVSWANSPAALEAVGQVICTVSDVSTAGTFPFTFSIPARYVRIWVDANTSQATDRFFRIKAIRVFNQTAYESGNQSILKTSDVLKDALPRLCGQWSADVSGIDATLLNLPELAPTQPRNFRELTEALNSLHGYIRKLERGRRFRFKPRPLVPVLAAGRWPGIEYKDTAKNATRDIFNKAIGRGTGPDGSPLEVMRYASQQPNVQYEAISTPGPDNPSFATDVASWTASVGAFVRTTTAGEFDTAPAGGKWTASKDATLTETFSGTFLRGVTYMLVLRAKGTGGGDPAGPIFDITFGVPGTDFTTWFLQPVNAFADVVLIWMPSFNRTGVTLQVRSSEDAQVFYVDSLGLFRAAPTLLDKRGRIRSQTVTVSQGTDRFTLQALSDVWLQTHMRTRARGDLTATGRSLRDFTSGDTLDPFEVGEKTGELVCLLDEIDPDTGALGRDVPIATVTYSGNDETASIGLDDARDDFEKLAARYSLLSGGSV